MVDQLLWIDALFKLSFGIALLVLPHLLIKTLGLPKTKQAFYPRLVGALLVGLAFALMIEGAGDASSGLALHGAVAINLSVSFFIVVRLLFADPTPTRRGRFVLWGLVFLLLALSLMQSIYG